MPRWKEFSKGDLLRPSSVESWSVLVRSQSMWRSLLSVAQCATQFSDSCFDIRTLLHKTPSLPDASSIMETVEGDRLFLHGYSQWKLHSTADCDLSSESKRSRSQKIAIGSAQPTFCRLSNEFHPKWTVPDAQPTRNYLCVFILGWSYVLSARLVELRKVDKKDNLSYTNEKAPLSAMDRLPIKDHFSILVREADEQELRWWAAILADGCGWRATLTRLDKEYFSLWACHLSGDEPFAILHEKLMDTSAFPPDPPSSMQAQSYLLRFAEVENAVDQLIAAFMAVLTIPSHMRFGTPVVLPKPQSMTGLGGSTQLIGSKRIPSFDELPYLMALSCIPNAVTSCLFGCFWEPGVCCNLVSELLYHPLQQVLPQLIDQKQCHIIVQMMAAHRPNVAPLWLGSAITGLLPRILQICKSYISPICPEATVWTASPQSFMDSTFHRRPDVSRNVRFEKVIPREDEFRLLYMLDLESQVYGGSPLCPYPPFGVAKLQNTALEVKLHVSCGHRLIYSHWAWQVPQGSEHLDDVGFTPSGSISTYRQPTYKYSVLTRCYGNILPQFRRKVFGFWSNFRLVSNGTFDESLSERATRNLFSWIFFADGVRLEDKEMWGHEWLALLLNPRDNDVISNSSFSFSLVQRRRSQIPHWLESIPGSEPGYESQEN